MKDTAKFGFVLRLAPVQPSFRCPLGHVVVEVQHGSYSLRSIAAAIQVAFDSALAKVAWVLGVAEAHVRCLDCDTQGAQPILLSLK